jgi:two-component system, LytTR family, sensor kinase
MFTNKYRYVFIALLGLYSYVNTLFSEVHAYYGINAPWYAVMLCMVGITLLVWEGNRLLLILLRPRFGKTAGYSFLLLCFAAGAAMAVATTLLFTYLLAKWVHLPASQLNITLKLAFTYGTRINVFMHILHAIAVFMERYRQKQLEAEELKRMNTQAQLQAIKNQVNPHFLFNNLNVLSGMVMKDNPGANSFIEAFSTVYRHILNSQDKELVTLATELDFIKPYIFLLEKRFPDSIKVRVDINENHFSHYVVPASLQMLVENAIKHNVLSKARPLEIFISINKNGDLFVKNNLQLKQQVETSTQVGLKNIEQRYIFITGRNIDIVKDDNSFTVTIPLIHQPL